MKALANILCSSVTVLTIAGCAGRAPETTQSTSNDLAVTPIGGDGGCPGVGTVVCLNGGHFDPQLCECVAPDAGCVDNVLCIVGDHFDPVLCKCVPNVCVSNKGGPCGGFTQNPCRCASGLVCVPNRIPDIPGTCEECETATDCHGGLHQLCEVCPNGGDGCAHWSCVAGQCAVRFCE